MGISRIYPCPRRASGGSISAASLDLQRACYDGLVELIKRKTSYSIVSVESVISETLQLSPTSICFFVIRLLDY